MLPGGGDAAHGVWEDDWTLFQAVKLVKGSLGKEYRVGESVCCVGCCEETEM